MCENNCATRSLPKIWHPGRADLDKNQLKRDVICIPWDAFQRGRRLIEIIINHAHQTIGHYGQWKTSNYIQRSYWWPQMATDIEAFCRSCRKCQTNKTDMQKPQGLLHSLPIPDKLWQFVIGFGYRCFYNNLVLRSDTIDLGIPWSLMTSLRNSHATSFAVTHVVVGTRCTCDMSRSMITIR